MLNPAVNESEQHDTIDEAARATGLHELRQRNFLKIMHLLRSLRPKAVSESMLDVGAAHGWFIDAARGIFREVLGIEPDVNVASATITRGVMVRIGYFPSALVPEERFDVIVFNDVFEHIPDASSTLTAIRAHLHPQGLLVLSLPTSNGFFYQLARLLRRIGICGAFDRMWQKGMPSPHLHYFSTGNLNQLLTSHGFRKEAIVSLPSLQRKRLYERIALSKQNSALTNRLLWVGLIVILPLIRLLPQDTRVFAYSLAISGSAE